MRARPRAGAFVTLACLLAAPCAPAQAPAASPAPRELLERVVAVIDDRPLLLSEVRALAAVRGLSAESALEAAIDERLMAAEAARGTAIEVGADELERLLDDLQRRRPALASAVSRAELQRIVLRQVTILRYVEFRFRPQVRVSDEEVRRAWEADEVGRPSGVPLEDAQDAIRARLERQALDLRVEAWVAELRARADLRRVEPAPRLD